jgi:hypothetical protein
VFNITTNGADEVTVYIGDGNDGESASFGDDDNLVDFLVAGSGNSIEGTGNAVTLAPGEGVSVQIVIDIDDTEPGDLLDGEIVIVAEQ